ncbi:hypothetical protein BJV78DRAFT_1159008 [Lactifluus subvellereus]|nr:hypothetical protein BJV78DRAFT_1159008 [Lactifluus subvellereus]
MAFPNPTEAPTAFIEYLEAANLDFCVTLFKHLQNKPPVASNARLDETSARDWIEGMFLLYGRLGLLVDTQPEHQSVLCTLKDLCSQATAEVEARLKTQKEADTAAQKERDDAERARLEKKRLLADQAEWDQSEARRKVEEGKKAMEDATRDLAAKKKAFEDAQKAIAANLGNLKEAIASSAGGGSEDDNDDEDEGTESPPEQQAGEKLTKRQLDQQARRKMQQVVHANVCLLLY